MYLLYKEGVLFYPDLDDDTVPINLLHKPDTLSLRVGMSGLRADGSLMVGIKKKMNGDYGTREFVHFLKGSSVDQETKVKETALSLSEITNSL